MGPIVIGLDPGLRTFGMAAVELGLRRRLLDMRSFYAPASKKLSKTVDRCHRTLHLGDEIADFVDQWPRVALACIEASWLTQGHTAVISLAIGFGTTVTVLGSRGIPMLFCTPASMKKAVTGDSGASDIRIRRCLGIKYPNARVLTRRLSKQKCQHPYEGLGAVETIVDSKAARAIIERSTV
jgi:Holliday junction resolvasome RuvABC endonuclease subunit